jgi:tRNA-intron lyase
MFAKPKKHTVQFESFDYLDRPPQPVNNEFYSAFYCSNNRRIIVPDPMEARDLYRGGFYGKGTLSRSGPVTLDNRNIQNLKEQVEYLQLLPEEAFYLSVKLNILKIYKVENLNQLEDRNILSEQECWDLFNSISISQCFAQDYALYAKYRDCGWVVRSGQKFAGKYVVYRKGPAFYHASYNVRIVSNSNSPIIESWRQLSSWNRVTSSVSKELVIASPNQPFILISMKRWSPNANRE